MPICVTSKWGGLSLHETHPLLTLAFLHLHFFDAGECLISRKYNKNKTTPNCVLLQECCSFKQVSVLEGEDQ